MINLKTSLGIEFRENDLVLVCLKRGLKGTRFADWKLIPNYQQSDRAELKADLWRFIKKHHVARENMVVGIPRDRVVIRYLELPREAEENLAQVIKFQVESLMPTEEDTSYYDFVILNPGEQQAKLHVLLVMIKKAALDEYLAFMDEMGVHPSAIQISSVALYNLMLMNGNGRISENTYVLFDCSERKLEVLAVKGRQLLYARSRMLEEGGANFDLLLGEVEVALSAMRVEDSEIEKIYLSGKGAEGLLNQIKQHIPDCELLTADLEVTAAQPAEVPPSILDARNGQDRALTTELATATGLALGGMVKKLPLSVNLLPEERRIKYSTLAFVPTIVLSATVLALLVAIFARPFVQERIMLTRLDSELASLKQRVNEVTRLRDEVKLVEQKIKFAESVISRPDYTLDILKELTTLLRDDTYLQTFIYNENDITMMGLSGSPGQLVQVLEKSPYFKEVSMMGPVTRDPSGKERFNLKAKLEK